MKKNEFTVIIRDKATGEQKQEVKTASQNKMWTTCRETMRADEACELQVDVMKDGNLFKSFTRVARNGKRAWWMHNAVKATNRKWMLKMEREAKAKEAQANEPEIVTAEKKAEKKIVDGGKKNATETKKAAVITG